MELGTVKVSNLSVSYLGTPVLQDINFEVAKGQMVGIIGPNGAGKSTLMKAMLGLVKASGEVIMDKNFAYMRQGGDYDLSFPILVKEVVMLGMYPALGLFKRPKSKHWSLVEDALRRVGMEAFKNRQIARLSGGQWQRVLIARLLIQNADVIFLDEPFTGIDIETEAKLIEILWQLRDAGKSIFMVYHDLEKVNTYFDEVILINQVVIAKGAPSAVLSDKMLRRAYLRGVGL